MLLSEQKVRLLMLNYQEFLKAQIINKNGETGEVVSFDEDRITIRYQEGEKVYNPEVAMRNGFLSFVDERLKRQYSDELAYKDKMKKQREELIRKIDADRPIKIKRVNKINKQYEEKMRVLWGLFGRDFVYPPYVKFLKNYKDLITKPEDIFKKLFRYYEYGYKYD